MRTSNAIVEFLILHRQHRVGLRVYDDPHRAACHGVQIILLVLILVPDDRIELFPHPLANVVQSVFARVDRDEPQAVPIAATTERSTVAERGARVRSVQSPGPAKNRN